MNYRIVNGAISYGSETKLQVESSDELIKNYTESLERYEFEGGYT